MGNMYYGRTQEGVDEAKKLFAQYLNGEIEMSTRINIFRARYTLNVDTINRITDQQSYLQGIFNSMYYFSEEMDIKTYTTSDYFKQSDFDLMLSNCNKLEEAFYLHKATPAIPDHNMFRWQTINALEYLLGDFDLMINDMKSYYRECGDCECGGE